MATAEQDSRAVLATGITGMKGLRLLVVIPALDEARTVASVVRGIPRDLDGVCAVEVLVIDDGSADETAAEARRADARVISHPDRLGVGAAFASGIRYAVDSGADLVVTIDADGQFDPASIPELIRPIIAGEADFATASRFADPALVPAMPVMKRWGNRVMAGLVSRLTGQTFFDVSCGMRCYSRRALLLLNPMGRFTYTQEVFLNLAFKQVRIVEVPIAVRGEREHGESRVAGNLLRYALRTSGIIFRSYRDYKPMAFFGTLAAAAFAVAFALGGFLLVHYLSAGSFSPHKWAGFSAAAIGTFGLLLLFMGVLGDMLNRHRVYLEELLYRSRDRHGRGESGD